MLILIARKQYVYQFMEEMLTDIRFVKVESGEDAFIELIDQLDYFVIAKGDFEPGYKNAPILTVQEFAEMYFLLEKNTEPDSGLTKGCDKIRDYLSCFPH